MGLSTTKLYFFNLFVKIFPPTRGNALKVRLLRWAGAKVGKNVSIFTPQILGKFNLVIGDNCWLGYETMLQGPAGSRIELKDYAKLGTRVIVVTGSHDYHPKYDCVAGPGTFGNVTIGKGAIVSTGSMICPGKNVGDKSHVAACSVVTHDVPPFTRVAGCPARVIKEWRDEAIKQGYIVES